MNQSQELIRPTLTEASIRQVVQIAERLRDERGGYLDDSAISAIAEICSTPEDDVRLALSLQGRRRGFLESLRASFANLNPNVRRLAAAGLLGSATGGCYGLAIILHEIAQLAHVSDFGMFFDVGKMILIASGLYNVSVSKDVRAAAMSGGIFAAAAYAIGVIIAALYPATALRVPSADYLIFVFPAGLVGGAVLHKVVDALRPVLGMKDPVKERQELLRQLVELQTKLRSGEQELTFLSVDIVGSTKMKESADPLSVEFTFNEYHQFVDLAAQRFAGRVHSTAGDGVTCAFDTVQQAFSAGKNIQTGIFEINALRNKIGVPLELRVGIHSGKVVAPDAEDITSVNFAHVIDVAAHVQKACPPGSVAISEAAAAKLPTGVIPADAEAVEVGGLRALVWRPKKAIAVSSAMPPPVPKGITG